MAPDPVIDVVVGYLATHAGGYEARLGPDRTLAEYYAKRNHATLEPMYVKRIAKQQQQWPKMPESKLL